MKQKSGRGLLRLARRIGAAKRRHNRFSHYTPQQTAAALEYLALRKNRRRAKWRKGDNPFAHLSQEQGA